MTYKKSILFISLIFLGVLFIGGCGHSDNGDTVNSENTTYNDTSNRKQITFADIGDFGIFDPSLTQDPNNQRLWMTYSEVDLSTWPSNKQINTRLAYSDNAGADWNDDGIVNQSVDVTLPGDLKGTWVNEVSSICYDPYAPTDESFKVVWHRYLVIDENRHFEHGWIGMKAASSPETLKTAAERKLFVGSGYDDSDDTIIGVPEVHLDQLDAALNACVAFSEPAIFAANDACYVALLGTQGSSTTGKIVLIKYPYPNGPWEYKGTFIDNSIDGAALGYDGFTAPSVYEKNGIFYLMASPQTNNMYLGTMIFEITDLDTAVIKRNSNVPEIITSIFGTEGSHNGAAGYIPQASACGVLYSEVFYTTPLAFKIYMSFVNP